MKIQRFTLVIIVALFGLLAVLPTTSVFAQADNHAPIISADFPDTVITKQGVAHRDSIFALPLADFGYDADGDSLIWSTSTEDSIGAFFSSGQETLYVHSAGDWYGRGRFTVKLEDLSGAYDEKEVAVVAFKRDGTLLSADGTQTEYYVPWHP